MGSFRLTVEIDYWWMFLSIKPNKCNPREIQSANDVTPSSYSQNFDELGEKSQNNKISNLNLPS